MVHSKSWFHLRFRQLVINPLYRKLYLDRDPDIKKCYLVVGTARSGTTWLSSIIASQVPVRVMFEPFHSGCMPEYHSFNYFQYMRPSETNSELLSFCQKVFSGMIRHSWIDREVKHVFPKFRLVKDIRINLFLKWIRNAFPDLPILFMIRHPCAVVLSRMQLGWEADGDLQAMCSQAKLAEDYLNQYLDILEHVRTIEEKHALVWCIHHLVPLNQFASEKLNIVFYEDLCIQPESVIPGIFAGIGQAYQDSVYKQLDRPSSTTKRSSAVMLGEDRVMGWKEKLSTRQISNILSVVDAFGLGYLYGDSVFPERRTLSLTPSSK